MTPEEADAFHELSVVHRYPEAATFFLVGAAPREVCLLEQGQVKVMITSLAGRELSALDGHPHSASAVALTECQVRVIPLTQSDMASWAGLSREAVVKGFRQLRALGLIENNGAWFLVLDRQGLADRAQI